MSDPSKGVWSGDGCGTDQAAGTLNLSDYLLAESLDDFRYVISSWPKVLTTSATRICRES
ncbi:MAG: hypothetical protein GY904_22795 [Planctomycetaceae bacterium]|nr:hypothetical protein [Planctomycetaceae bacterium]